MDARAVDKLRKLAAENPELQDLLTLPEDPVPRELLFRAALPRRFDEPLFTSVLVRDLEPAPGFRDFVRHREVERVPYTQGQFWVNEPARRAYLDQWRNHPDRALWARRLAQYLSEQPQPGACELLELTLRFDEAEARRMFERLYGEADGRSDLAACFALVQVLGAAIQEQEESLSQETHRLHAEYAALYKSRALFVDEFHLTVRYFPRRSAEAAFDSVLQERSRNWIWHLHGGGGLGKTTLLRRLIAHRLVPRPARVGCVRIDFDAISVSALVTHPWLIGIPIAEQLDPQLDYQVFGGFLHDTQPFRRLLTAGPALEAQSQEQTHVIATLTDYWQLLLTNFASVPPDKMVVVFLDTLEEASLHRRHDLLTIVDRLAALRAVHPRLRVVLSGRYALGLEPGHVPDYFEKYGRATKYSRLKRLSAGESTEFVKASAPDVMPDVIPAIVERGNGNPFKLALLGELVQADDTITAERIRGPEFENIDETYLIERVVRRIPVAEQLPVRWVIRYGVVPRRLTRDFVAEVLLPALARALAGSAEESGDDLVEEYLKRTWPARSQPLDAATIWTQLASYSTQGGHGWIEIPRADPEVARFHADVVNPMRRLLRKQRVFASLHRQARAHFQEKGAAADVLFHQMELDREGFPERVREAFAQPRLRHDAAAWRRLAEELTTRDFASVPAGVRAFIHLQVAEAICASQRYDLLVGGPDFDMLRTHVDVAGDLAEQAGRPTVPTSWPAALEAVARFREAHSRSERMAAIAGVERAAKSAGRAGGGSRLWLLLGDMRVREEVSQGVRDAYASAARAIREGDAGIPIDIPLERLGDWMRTLGQWLHARRYYEEALSRLEADGNAARSERLRGQIIQVDIGSGHWEEARRDLERVADRPEWWSRLQATTALALWRPLEAASICETLLQGSLPPVAAADARYLRARSYQQQGLLTQATAEYRAARDAFSAGGDFIARDRCRLEELRAYVLQANNLAQARTCFNQGPLETGDVYPYLRVDWDLMEAFVWKHEPGRQDRPRRTVESLIEFSAGKPPQLTAMVLATALTLRVKAPDDVMPDLLRALDAVEPVSARLALLSYLPLGGAWQMVSRHDADEMEARIPFAPDGDSERPVWALQRAELLRVIGRGEAANELLKAEVALPDPGDPDSAIAFQGRLEAERRLRSSGAKAAITPLEALVDALAATTALPLVRAAIAVAAAEAALQSGDTDAARRFLGEAEAPLATEVVETRYHVRARDLAAKVEPAQPAPPPPRVPAAAPAPEAPVPAPAPVPAAPAPAPAASRRPPSGDRGALLAAVQKQAESAPARVRLVGIHHSAEQYVVQRPPFLGQSLSRKDEPLTWLAEAIQARSTSALPERIVGRWQELASLFRGVLDGLDVPGRLPPGSRERGRLWLDLPPELAPAPWELVQIDPDVAGSLPPIRCTLARPPLDGPDPLVRLAEWLAREDSAPLAEALGHAPERAERAREQQGPGRPRVLLLDGTRLAANARYVSSHAYSGLRRKLENAADVVRADPSIFEETGSPRALAEALQHIRPTLLYLVSALFDSPRLPAPVLQAGQNEPKVVDLAIAAARLPEPLTVIVDVPATGSALNDASQLLARNRFASELFSLGNVPAVLATGLGTGDEQDEVHDAIVRNLAGPHGQDAVLDDLRSVWEKHPQAKSDAHLGLLPLLATALFSNNPYERLARPAPASP
jgi:hypothetical protein